MAIKSTNQRAMDVTKWSAKVKALQHELGPALVSTVKYASDTINEEVVKNLSGSVPGTIPVNVVTGTLRRSKQMQVISEFFHVHFMDTDIANYAEIVHRKRPYFRLAVEARKPAIMNRMKYNTIKQIRAIGRA